MSRHNKYRVDPHDDDASDAGDPLVAGQEFLKSLSRSAREAITHAGTAVAGLGNPGHSGDGPTLHGPQPRLQFFWHGRRCEFRNAEDRYVLVTALWNTDTGEPYAERDLDEVLDALYGEDEEGSKRAATLRRGRLKNLRFHVGQVFLNKGIPLAVRCGGGKLWLEELP